MKPDSQSQLQTNLDHADCRVMRYSRFRTTEEGESVALACYYRCPMTSSTVTDCNALRPSYTSQNKFYLLPWTVSAT